MSWVTAYATRAGADHDACDDVCVCEALGDYLIAAVADGAGSADKGGAGAALACQVFVELGVEFFSGAIEPQVLIRTIQDRIPVGEADTHSCTLVGVVAGPKDAMFVQIGDGAIVFRNLPHPPTPSPLSRDISPAPGLSSGREESGEGGPHIYEVALRPEETEFLNHTFFVTMPDAVDHLQVRRVDTPIHEVAIFSDGLQHLVLDLRAMTPHQPFFQTVFQRLGEKAEHDLRASWWLERTLASEPVTRRTDDDTSIVIARRLPC